MSDSVRPHRWQPTRLTRPWDSPGKNTGVGCHFLLQCMKVKSESEVVQSCPTLGDPMDCSLTRLLHPWDFPGKSTGVGCHFLLQLIRTAAAAKSLQLCPTLCDPIDSSPPGSPVPGILQAEYWSRLPFPSPMRESDIAQSCLTLSDPMDCSPPGSSVHGIFQARVLEWGAIAFSGPYVARLIVSLS